MAIFSVMADVPNPLFDSDGDPFSGAVLKAFLPGSTTSISIAIDKDGGSPQASITYNAQGKLEVTGNEILPYIDRLHKWGIFANATDAAANAPFYMGPFDEVPQPFGEGFEITITKFKPTTIEGQTVIVVPAAPTEINLFISGVLQHESDGDYTYSSPTITLSGALSAEDVVEVQFGLIVPTTGASIVGLAAFATVAQVVLDTGLEVGDRFLTYAFNVPVTCIWEVVVANTGAGDLSDGTLDLTGSGFQARLQIQTVMTPKCFGAVGNGIADDTTAITNCDLNSPSWLIDAVYASQELTLINYVNTVGSGELKWIGTDSNPVPVFVKLNSKFFGKIKVDGQNKEIKAFLLNGGVQTGDELIYSNIQAIDSLKNLSCGALVQSTELTLRVATAKNLLNISHVNDSFPQSFICDNGAVVYLGEHNANDCTSGLVNNGGDLHFDSNVCTNMLDNGLYNLAGETIGSRFVYQGNEEPIVNLSRVIVDHVTTVGKTFSIIRAQNAQYTKIGVIHSKAPEGTADALLWTNVATGIYEHRSGNTVSGPVFIGRVEGLFYLSMIRTGFSSGTTEKLHIGSMQVDLILRDEALDVNWNKQNWFNMSGCLDIDVRDMTVTILDVDDSLTSDPGDILFSQNPLTPTGSIMENFDVYIKAANGTISTNGVFRGEEPALNVQILGGRWQTNVGPYMREADYFGGARDIMEKVPVGGVWRQGQIFSNIDPATPLNWFYRCDVSGEPGTWSTLT
jgi:hypothetical protein